VSWEEAWQEGRTGWDAGVSSPALRKLVQRDDLPGGRALVPGCGSGYDVFTLARAGWTAVGLELAATAAQRFKEVRADAALRSEQAQIAIGDFFEWEPDQPFDLIWDYTFLCAIEPEMREAWAKKMSELLAPEGQLVTLIFPVDPSRGDEGPPYQMSPDLVTELLTPGFENLEMTKVDESHPGREGKEWLARWRVV
jgi:SAM-dependent methyltransferase